jgi:hypothetical protein
MRAPFMTLAAVCLLLLVSFPTAAQIITGSITGTVQDPQGAVIPNAKVTLINNAQGAASAREVPSNSEGIYLFTPVLPGTYTLTVEVPGFKKYTQSNLVVNVNDRVGLAPIALEVGSTGESVTVEASAVQLETVTAERSGVITGRQMVDIALNGRNFTGLLKTVPGVPADAGTGTATINGQRGDQNNFTVDGQTVIDIGVNQQFAYRINVDAIAEFKVSTNSQGAEFGRNSGAQIQAVTRSGTRDFHATGWWFKRGEFMNANNFINNAIPTQRQPDGTLVPAFPAYRYMQAGFTAGGPIFIPGKFNKSRDKLFGFMSQEWGRQFTPNAPRQITVPTAAERAGDMSNSRDAAGIIQTIYDPLGRSAANPLGTPFPLNRVPAARFNEHGPSVMNWLPLPNVFGQPTYNYQSQAANENPTFDQVYRVDYNMTEKWRFFVRHLNSKNTQIVPYGRADTSNNLGLSRFAAPTYGWSLAANATTIINPTLTNDFQFGYTVNGIPGDPPPAGSPYYRSVSNIKIPLLYPNADKCGCVPNFIFGGTPGLNQMTAFQGTPYDNRNPVWNWTDNITKLAGVHTLKFGIFLETAVKTENAFKSYNSTINFGRDSNNPNDTNWAYSNALIGTFQQYSQINNNPLPNYPYRNFEFYGQDTWKIAKRLTLNYGLRVSFIKPFYDKDDLMSNFDYSKFDPSKAVKFYLPNGTGTNRRALNPITGELLPAVYIGAIVPGSGDINNGMVRSGQGGTPRGLIENRGAHFGPRIGLAYQINNKTVFRTGGGVFYERIATFGVGITSNYTTNPPLTRTSELYYGNLSTIQSAGGTFFPASITRLSSDGHVPTVYNFNAGIQRELPMGLLLDVSYVGSQSRHLWLSQPANNVPFGSAWLPSTQDPTGSRPLDGTSNLPVNIYRPYAGFSNFNDFTWGASSNYNALQISVNRRRGPLQIGFAYTYSKALGVIQGHILDARKANYGPLAINRPHSLTFNYIYDVPSLARKSTFLDNAIGKGVFGGWQLSGLTSISSGAPVNVTYSITGIGAQELNRRITGSEDQGPRVVFTCNPNLSRDNRNIDAFINTSCFAPAQKGSVQMDSGLNQIIGPGLHNWDMNVFKNIQMGEKGPRLQLRLEAYNFVNHTQWGGINTVAQFNAAGVLLNKPNQLGGTGGRYGFGALSAVRANSQRILQIAVKLYF